MLLCACVVMQAVAQGYAQGRDNLDDDEQSSTTWYESATHDAASSRSQQSFVTAQADSLTAAERAEDADEFASIHSTNSFVSASGSFHSNASYRTTHSQQSSSSGAAIRGKPGAAGSVEQPSSGTRVVRTALQSALYRNDA